MPLWLPLLLLAMLSGCRCPTTAKATPCYGPTLAMDRVVERINANNRQIPTLHAKHYTDAYIFDPQRQKTVFVNAGGDLFVRKPGELLMVAKKDALASVFTIGSTGDRYWVTAYGEVDTRWWGWHRNVGKPCLKEMPVRPDLLGEVLGISEFATDLLAEPAPVMRFNNDACVYMFVWSARGADRWYAVKEVWYDQKDLRPLKVLLFDANGRIILRADLTEHAQVRLEDLPAERGPWMATRYALWFPENKSKMEIKLSEMALTTKTGQPKPGGIRFPENLDVAHEVQTDKDCGD